MELLDAVDHPAVAMMLDTFHMHMEEASIPEAIRLAGERIVHFQANENHRGFPGTGATDWVAVFRALHEIGYAGPISLEPFRRNDDRFGVPFAQWRAAARGRERPPRGLRRLHPLTRRADGVPAMTLNIGWIGCGIHATQMLLPQLVRHDVRIVAVCDIDGARLQAASRQFGVATLTTDAAELIATPGLDAVGMAVGPDQHLAFGIAALERGLPVFMEKPPSGTAEARANCRAASERAGKPLLVGFMKRYSIGNRIAHNIIKSGRFGDVLGLTGYYMTAPGYFVGNVDYTGFLLHHCVHYMDLASFLVSPIAEPHRPQGREDAGPHPVPRALRLRVRRDRHRGDGHDPVAAARRSSASRSWATTSASRSTTSSTCTWHRNPPFKVDDLGATLDAASDTLTWKPNFTAAANEDYKGYHALLADVVPALRGEVTSAPTIHDGVAAMEWLGTMRRTLSI